MLIEVTKLARTTTHQPCPGGPDHDRCRVLPPRQCTRCAGTGRYRSLGNCLWCGGTGKSSAVIWCFRGGKLYPLDRDYVPPPPRIVLESSLASIERRHNVFSALLDRCELQRIHADHLETDRGLSDDTITRAQFATTPGYERGNALAKSLSCEFDLAGVPGFFSSKGGRWYLRFSGVRGFYVPIRDARGRIEALQVRRWPYSGKNKYLLVSGAEDWGTMGTSAGAPVHYARAHQASGGDVVITEGALKAEIVAEHLRCAVVGLVAVGTFGERFGAELRAALPTLERVHIAYDADWVSNKQVAAQMLRLGAVLRAAGLAVEVMGWRGAKGLDDWLLREAA